MLDFNGLNYWAILVAWFVFTGIGSFWYSPAGFGKLWSKLSGVNIMKIPQQEATRSIAYVVVASLLQAFTLAVVLNTVKVANALEGLEVALLLWAGLTAATTIGINFYQRKSWKFWWLNASFFLVTFAINGLLFGLWK